MHLSIPRRQRVIKPGFSRLDLSHPLARFATLAVFDGRSRDASLANRQPTYTGAITEREGLRGKSLDVSGTANYVTYGGGSVLGPTTSTPFTIAMRVYLDSIAASYAGMGFQAAGSKGFNVIFSSAAAYQPISFGARATSQPYYQGRPNTATAIPAGEWIDVAIGYNGAGNVISSTSMYHNQVLQTITAGANFTAGNSTALGATCALGNLMDGAIDYCVVLAGINAPHLLQHPDQVMGMIDSPKRTYFIPAAAGGTVYNRTSEDTFTTVDADTRTATFARDIAEALALVDATTQALAGIERDVADTLTFTDATSYTREYARTVADVLAFADTATRVAIFSRAISEALAFVDSTEATGGEVTATSKGGQSMTLRQMRNLERRQLLAMLRDDDEIIVALVADLLAKGRRLN